MSHKSRNILKVLTLTTLILLVFGFNFANIYCLAQGKPTVKVDVPATTPDKPKQAQDDPNFVPKIIQDSKLPDNIKPASLKKTTDDIKIKMENKKLEKAEVLVLLGNKRGQLTIDETIISKNLAEKIVEQLKINKDEYRIYPSSGELMITVDKNKLDELASLAEVFDVRYDDREVVPQLSDSVPQINDISVQTKQFGSGDGKYIAIIDTGVNKNHVDFGSRVEYEACYVPPGSSCPNSITNVLEGSGYSSYSDAGIPCLIVSAKCYHGTHVAGIAAGQNGTARNAKILAFNVYGSLSNNIITSTTGNIKTSLLKILELQTQSLSPYYNKIASTNISLGVNGQWSGGNCDNTNFDQLNLLDTITALSNAGVTTVIATGNEYQANGVSYPSCLSRGTAVSGVDKTNVMTIDANSANITALLAPGGKPKGIFDQDGVGIKSSDGYSNVGSRYLYGTSQAAPHVAGAIAQLKSLFPNRTEQQYLDGLQLTGDAITDTRSGANNRVKPRINMENAYNYLCQTPPISGTWKINNDCIIDKNVSYQNGNIQIGGDPQTPNNANVTIKNTGILDVNFINQTLTVRNGSKLFIQNGGKMY